MTVSLRRRLIAILLGLVLAAWSISMLVTAVVAQQAIARQAEKQLESFMDVSYHMLVAILEDPAIKEYFRRRSAPFSADSGVIHLKSFGIKGQNQAANFWYHQRQFLIANDIPPFPEPVADGFVTTRLGQGDDATEWRILYRSAPTLDAWLAVGVNMENVQSVAAATLWRVVLPLLVVLPVTAAILFWGVGRGLSPLHSLAQKISTRKPHALNPIDSADVPLEIEPVVASVNELLGRLERALTSESRFTSNAAHELQTPLAAIKTSVQQCQRQVKDDDTREMLDLISTRISRATTTVKQLLTLARLEPDQAFEKEPVDLGNLLIDVISDVGGLAAERGIEIRMGDVPTLFVRGNRDWLAIMLQNLLVNAFSHSPSSAEVKIGLDRDGAGARLSMSNDSEPISDEELSKLTDRFYRPSRNKQEGAGLGLSIVQRICELHEAELRIDRLQGERGLRVEVRFPRAK